MRDTAEAEFDRVNHLVDHHLTKVVLLLCLAMNNEKVQIADLVSNLRVRHPYLPQSPGLPLHLLDRRVEGRSHHRCLEARYSQLSPRPSSPSRVDMA